VLAIHNTAVITPSSDYNSKEDILRMTLKSRLREMGHDSKIRELKYYDYTDEIIKSVFESAGFKLKDSKAEKFTMRMRDRLLMWRCRAVLNCIVDINKIEDNEISSLIDYCRLKVINEPTKDMIVTYWLFQKNSDF
jgi:hypothetical protein